MCVRVLSQAGNTMNESRPLPRTTHASSSDLQALSTALPTEDATHVYLIVLRANLPALHANSAIRHSNSAKALHTDSAIRRFNSATALHANSANSNSATRHFISATRYSISATRHYISATRQQCYTPLHQRYTPL